MLGSWTAISTRHLLSFQSCLLVSRFSSLAPDFNDKTNLSDLVKMGSVNKANSIGSDGLRYGMSYAQSGLRSHAALYEDLKSDIFFCQFAAEVLKTSDPAGILNDAIYHLTDIASYAFNKDTIAISVHGKKDKFDLIQVKIEMMLNQIKNENSRYS
jgi:Zn-dependent M16 (insulinase) family peptidase